MKRIRGLALPPGLRPTSMAPCHVPEHVVTASENDTFEALGRWPLHYSALGGPEVLDPR